MLAAMMDLPEDVRPVQAASSFWAPKQIKYICLPSKDQGNAYSKPTELNTTNKYAS